MPWFVVDGRRSHETWRTGPARLNLIAAGVGPNLIAAGREVRQRA
jgi:hypothetical protein